jgi:hypothetical protein
MSTYIWPVPQATTASASSSSASSHAVELTKTKRRLNGSSKLERRSDALTSHCSIGDACVVFRCDTASEAFSALNAGDEGSQPVAFTNPPCSSPHSL